MQPVSIGVPAEVYIGGDGLAKGYWNRPQLTAQNFLVNPFDDNSEARLYRSGDLAKRLPDGSLDFLGRIDQQVKIRGYRIEPGEIEATLRAHASVLEAAVTVGMDERGASCLIAHVVAEDPVPSTATLRGFLGETLPPYMVPAQFRFTRKLPVTPSGKLDRGRLLETSEPANDAVEQESEALKEPANAVEMELLQIWQGLLGTKNIGVRSDFFELGGDSLLAVRLLSEVENKFGKTIAVAALFQASTIEKMAVLLRDENISERRSALVQIQPKGVRAPLFFVQSHLIFRKLAQHLGEDIPFIGLVTPTAEGLLSLPKLEDVASMMVQHILTAEPMGPYCIGGWSIGGILAFEIACQLEALGRDPLLLLLDAVNPHGSVRVAQGRRWRTHWKNIREAGGFGAVTYLLDRGKILGRRGLRAVWALRYRLQRDSGNPIDRKLLDSDRMLWIASLAYRARPFRGQVVLFRSETAREHYLDSSFGWSDVTAKRIDIRDLPGTHVSMLQEPNVKVVAEQIRECLYREYDANNPHVSGVP